MISLLSQFVEPSFSFEHKKSIGAGVNSLHSAEHCYLRDLQAAIKLHCSCFSSVRMLVFGTLYNVDKPLGMLMAHV